MSDYLLSLIPGAFISGIWYLAGYMHGYNKWSKKSNAAIAAAEKERTRLSAMIEYAKART